MNSNFTIHITPNAKQIFPTAKKVGEDLAYRFTFKDSAIIHPCNVAITEHAKTCAVVNINLGGHNGLLHLAPELNKGIDKVESNLTKFITKISEKVQSSKEQISAVIVGGKWASEKGNDSLESMNLLNNLAKFFDDRNIPLSIIFGKFNAEKMDNVHVKAKNMTIWNKSFDDLNLKEKPEKNDVINALQELYEVVEIAPEHKIDFIAK